MNTGSVNDERAAALRARLGRPEYHALFAAIRERLEGAVPELVRTVTLSGLTLAERQAILLKRLDELPPAGDALESGKFASRPGR